MADVSDSVIGTLCVRQYLMPSRYKNIFDRLLDEAVNPKFRMSGYVKDGDSIYAIRGKAERSLKLEDDNKRVQLSGLFRYNKSASSPDRRLASVRRCVITFLEEAID